MKYKAVDKNGNLIHVDDAISNPRYRNKREPLYYFGRQVIPKRGKYNNFYSFSEDSISSGSTTKTHNYPEHYLHLVVKQVISSLSNFKIHIYGKKFNLEIIESNQEVPIVLKESTFKVDILLRANITIGNEVLKELFAVEVHYKNSCNKQKYESFKGSDYTLLEIPVSRLDSYKKEFDEFKKGSISSDELKVILLQRIRLVMDKQYIYTEVMNISNKLRKRLYPN